MTPTETSLPNRSGLVHERRRRSGALSALVAVAFAAPGSVGDRASAQAPVRATLEKAQNAANHGAGARHVPAKTIPVPTDLDPGTAALVAGPYSTLWNLDPKTDDAWRDVQRKAAAGSGPRLAKTRAQLGVTLTPTTVGGVKAFILAPRDIPAAHRDQLVVHLHSGGYVMGAGESGTYEAATLAAYGGYKVLSVDYRMPPDAPYPAALDDTVAVWRALIKTTDPRHIAVEGSSAGGGLLLAMMLRLKAEGLPMPGAIAPGTPEADLTETGDSYRTNEWVDNVLVSYRPYLLNAIRLYAHGCDLRDPGLSPIYGDFHGLPPAILTTGTRDLFLSNTVRAHRKLREAGVDAELQVYEGLSHAQYTLAPTAPVTKEIFGEITRFFDRHLAK